MPGTLADPIALICLALNVMAQVELIHFRSLLGLQHSACGEEGRVGASSLSQ